MTGGTTSATSASATSGAWANDVTASTRAPAPRAAVAAASVGRLVPEPDRARHTEPADSWRAAICCASVSGRNSQGRPAEPRRIATSRPSGVDSPLAAMTTRSASSSAVTKPVTASSVRAAVTRGRLRANASMPARSAPTAVPSPSSSAGAGVNASSRATATRSCG